MAEEPPHFSQWFNEKSPLIIDWPVRDRTPQGPIHIAGNNKVIAIKHHWLGKMVNLAVCHTRGQWAHGIESLPCHRMQKMVKLAR